MGYGKKLIYLIGDITIETSHILMIIGMIREIIIEGLDNQNMLWIL